MTRWILLLALAACGGGGSTDACAQAFSHLSSLNVFGGDSYGAEGALALGMSCQELTQEDLACLGKAKTSDDLHACKHAADVAGEKEQLIAANASAAPQPDPALVARIADAFCACQDATCLVGVGERDRYDLEILFASGPSIDPKGVAAEQRLRECGDRLSAGPDK